MRLIKEQEYRRQRILPIDSGTLGMLREYIERGGPVVRNGKRLIFGINRHRAWQIIRQCAERAGLPNLINLETGRIHGDERTKYYFERIPQSVSASLATRQQENILP